MTYLSLSLSPGDTELKASEGEDECAGGEKKRDDEWIDKCMLVKFC